MTKEYILIKIDEPDNNLIFDGDNRIIGYDGDVRPVLRAMDEYARQQAIEFVKWAIDAEKIVGDYWGISFMPLMEEDVYNQFIEQQNKDNESDTSR